MGTAQQENKAAERFIEYLDEVVQAARLIVAADDKLTAAVLAADRASRLRIVDESVAGDARQQTAEEDTDRHFQSLPVRARDALRRNGFDAAGFRAMKRHELADTWCWRNVGQVTADAMTKAWEVMNSKQDAEEHNP